MGTSSSRRGPGSGSSLIPAGTDASPGSPPPPPPEGQRFRTFRTTFGQHASGSGSLQTALGHYARTATGGPLVGPRRFGPTYTAGGQLYDLLGSMREGEDGAAESGVDLSGYVRGSIRQAAQEIAQRLAPDNVDREKVAIAINESMVEALADHDTFDPAQFTLADLIAVTIEFETRMLFLQVVEDAGSAWNKAPSEARTIDAENELFDLIRVSVDKHLASRLATGRRVARSTVERAMRAAMDSVWRDWAAFE